MNTRLIKTILLFIVAALVVQACSVGSAQQTGSSPTEEIPNGPVEVIPQTTSVPDPVKTASDYLQAWSEFDYEAMYGMLTKLSQDAYNFNQFEERYKEVSLEAALTSIDSEILQKLTSPSSAQVAYRVTLNSALVGPISRDTTMDLSLEDGQWKVVWGENLILPELVGGNRLSMQVFTPSRGIIYDRNGQVMAVSTEAVALSVIFSEIEREQYGTMLNQLSVLTGEPINYLRQRILFEDQPYLTPIGVIPADSFNERESFLERFTTALSYTSYPTRLYYYDQTAGHPIGYVSSIPAEEVEEWSQRGYPVDAVVGRQGIEAWGENYLAGQRGGELYVVNADKSQRITILNSREAQPAQSIYTTLDANLQRWAQLAIHDFTGAAVVLERDTGRILAIASSPSFNPNDADYRNPISEWGSYFNESASLPFLNRATQGQYPPGSIFKLVTMAAALESGLYTPQSSLFCGHTWDKIGAELTDWTLEKGISASGELTLQEGLMRSCNPWFYEIGFSLYGAGEYNLIAEMARGFGLGSPTGLQELPEEKGLISDPDKSTAQSEPLTNAVHQAIGQSDTLITPLQAAVYTAAMGNGGTLFRPQMIERIENTNGQTTTSFEPIINGKLPISEDTLIAIQSGMRMVINNPRGTAYKTFANNSIVIYGKTGTAQNSSGDPHAWFIGYTNQNREDLPDIAIAVIVENQGDGSEWAAPIFLRLVEVYFTGQPVRTYPWETQIGILDEEYFLPEEELPEGATPEGESPEGGVVVTPEP